MNSKILLNKIDDSLDKLFREDMYKVLLQVIGRFYNYSLNNQLLITLQMPEAVKLAGYQEWVKLGRQVRRGSKGIAILASKFTNIYIDNKHNTRIRRGQITDRELKRAIELGIIKKERISDGIIGAYVFDLSQTDEMGNSRQSLNMVDGTKEMDGVSCGISGESNMPGKNVDLAQLIKLRVDKESSNIPNVISVDTYNIDSKNKKTITLSKLDKDIIIKSAEYAIRSYFGVSVSTYSFGCVEDWGKDYKNEEITREKLISVLDYISRIVGNIIDSIDATLEKDKAYSGELDELIVKEELADDMLSVLQARVLRDKLYT